MAGYKYKEAANTISRLILLMPSANLFSNSVFPIDLDAAHS